MRVASAIFAGLVVLAAFSVKAAPLPPATATPAVSSTTAPIELPAQGCGYAYRRTRWQDQWGNWHWGRCVPEWWGSLPRHQFSD